MKIYFLQLCLILCISSGLSAQDKNAVRFPTLYFNPYEAFHFIEFNKMPSPKNTVGFKFKKFEYLVPFGLAVEKDIFHKKRYLLSASTSVDVQFIFRNEDSQYLNGLRKTLYNIDFFLRVHNTILLTPEDRVRLSIFHRSSHLGDDYTVMNQIPLQNYWKSDEANYEAIQIQYAREHEKFMAYVGTQIGFRPKTPRKRLEFHHGLIARKLFDNRILSNFILGYDLKMLENNNYKLDLDIGLGYLINKNIHLRLNYFNGNIPFSRYEREIRTSWYGFGVYFNASRI